jgi:glutamate racemase
METSDAASKPIGVFDSGLGGLTVVRELLQAMPGEDIEYLGDSARVPYGIKSLETVRRFAREDAAFLIGKDPKMVVVACNTASAAAYQMLRETLPVPVVDVIRPGARAAVEATDGPIGVLATEATIDSGAYQQEIQRLDTARDVVAVAAPLLVPIVEEGREESDPIVLHVLCDYLRSLQRRRVGALILGCTHYPLLSGAIAKLMGPEVELISSARAAALEVQRLVCSNGMGNPRREGGRLHCYTTDKPERFVRLAQRFGGQRPLRTLFVGTDELEVRPGA